MNNPQIYVICLTSYNNGILHGTWIDATQELADIQAAIDVMLKTSPIAGVEEYEIHDYEGFQGYKLSGFTSIESAHEIAEFFTKHGHIAARLLEHFEGDLGDAQNAMDNYAGKYRSLGDFALDTTEQTTLVPKS